LSFKHHHQETNRSSNKAKARTGTDVLTCFCFFPLRRIRCALPGWVAATASISWRSEPPRARGCNGQGGARARGDEDEDEDEGEGAAAAIVSATAVSWRLRAPRCLRLRLQRAISLPPSLRSCLVREKTGGDAALLLAWRLVDESSCCGL